MILYEMIGRLKDKFNSFLDTVHPLVSPDEVQVPLCVNYVWVSTGKSDNPDLHSILAHNIARAAENARRYPEAKFNIWIDSVRLSEESSLLVQRRSAAANLPNIKIRNLAEIEGYNPDDLFGNGQKAGIWKIADLARLLVLDHCLKSKEALDSVYADFDCPDIRLQEVMAIVDKHSFSFGTDTSKDAYFPENGFFAFRNDRRGIALLHELIQNTIGTMSAGTTNGYRALSNLYEKIKKERRLELKDIAIHGVQPLTGTPHIPPANPCLQ